MKYYKGNNPEHFTNSVRTAMDKGAKQGVAEVNKSTKLEAKNQQRKHDLAKRIKTSKPERGHEERLHKRMSDEGDRSANDYR